MFACTALALALAPVPTTYPPDRSMAALEYVRLGMPSTDRRWSPADYAAAAEVLRPIAAADPSRLPRADSAVSGGVFGRIVATDNLAVLEGNAPVAGRGMLAGEYMAAVKQITLIYFEPSTKSVVFDDELAELLCLNLHIWLRLWPLLEDPAAPPPPDETARREARARKITADLLSSVLQSIADVDGYRTPARARMVNHLVAIVPKLARRLSSEQLLDFRNQVDRLATAESNEDLRASLLKLRAYFPEGK